MAGFNSPFGPSLPSLNLPTIQPLPVQQGRANAAPQQAMMVPELPSPAPMAAPQKSEFESIMSGLTGLLKQSRDQSVKEKEASAVQNLVQQLAALKAERAAAPDPAKASKPAAEGSSVDMDDYLARNAKFESGNNETAVNPGSGATGLFQFLPSTWNWIAKEAPELGLTPEGMKDRAQQMKAMRYYTNKSVKALEPILGRKPTGGELYLLHLLGHSGGPAVLSKLDAPLTETISEGARRGNPFLKQYETGRELIAGLNQRFGGSNA